MLTSLSTDLSTIEVLTERARALARPLHELREQRGEERLVFQLGSAQYALPARFVIEVQPLLRYTPLPTTPPYVLGLVNMRGKLLAAFDVRPLLDLAQTPPAPGSMLLRLRVNNTEIGLLADAVHEVQPGSGDLAPAPSAIAGHGTAWLSGVDQAFNLVLDPVGLLADPRLLVNTGGA